MAEKPGLLEQQLRDTRSIPDSMEEVFKILELKEERFDSDKHLPKSLLGQDKSIAATIFLSRYIIAIVRDFSKTPVDYDLILAAFGLLDGYGYPEVQDRHIQYCQNVGIYASGKNIPLIMHWADEDIDKSLNSKENSAIKRMSNKLGKRLVENGGALGYGAEAEKLIGKPFPPPNYLREYGYRKYEYDGKAFYVPLTNKELLSLANTSIKVAADFHDTKSHADALHEDCVKTDEPSMMSDTGSAEDSINDDNISQAPLSKKSENNRPEDKDKIEPKNEVLNQADADDAGQDKNSPEDATIKDASRYRRHRKRKAHASAKAGNISAAGASSNVSIHITNVVGAQRESNRGVLIQDKEKELEKIAERFKKTKYSPESSDDNKSKKRNRRILKIIIVVTIIILAVLLIAIIVVPKIFKDNPATSDYFPHSEPDWLRKQIETMNREIPRGFVNSVSATVEYTITDPETGETYTYTETISLEQNTDELEEPTK